MTRGISTAADTRFSRPRKTRRFSSATSGDHVGGALNLARKASGVSWAPGIAGRPADSTVHGWLAGSKIVCVDAFTDAESDMPIKKVPRRVPFITSMTREAFQNPAAAFKGIRPGWLERPWGPCEPAFP